MPLLIVSDPATGKSQKIELEDNRVTPLFGRRIGEVIEGNIVGLQGKNLKITGGTDKDGIPMRPDIHGTAKLQIILSGGVGYHTKQDGIRKRKIIRGNTIGPDSKFINMAVTEEAPKVLFKETEQAKPKRRSRRKSTSPKESVSKT